MICSDPTLFVTFLVGPNAVEFRIHREVIYQQCNVFKAAFESTMIEGQTQIYTLPDISEQCFSLFVQWTYAQKLNLFQLAKGYVHDEEATAEEDAENMALVELWVFGDRYVLPALQDHVINRIYDIFQATPTISTVTFQYIYANTLSEPDRSSVLRRFIVAMVAEWAGMQMFGNGDVVDTFPAQMLADICKLLANIKDKSGVDDIDMSQFWVDDA